MKLCIVTQKVDATDPILGFFHGWLEEFAAQCEEVHVVGQLVGQHNLPPNVYVYSLGKESGLSTWRQIIRYWSLLFKLQNTCDAVLVHMVPIWLVLALWCKLPMYLWYEARGTRWPLRVALWRAKKVFSASAHGMPLATEKSILVGHGIHTQVFVPGSTKEAAHIVTVGRITKSKRLEVLLQAFLALPEQYRLSIVGMPIISDDRIYKEKIDSLLQEANATKRVTIGPLQQSAIIPLLQRAQVFVHASETSLDKAVLEAMACGCPVVSSAAAVQPLLSKPCQASDAASLANAIQHVCNLPAAEYAALAQQQRSVIEAEHNLQKLVARLLQEM